MENYLIGIIVFGVVIVIMLLSRNLDLFKYKKYGKSRPASGQKKNNKLKLIREFGFAEVKFKEDESLSGYELKIKEERKRECT